METFINTADNPVGREMDVVMKTIKTAEHEGLLTEVVWTLAQSNTGTVQEKCMHALMEWDI